MVVVAVVVVYMGGGPRYSYRVLENSVADSSLSGCQLLRVVWGEIVGQVQGKTVSRGILRLRSPVRGTRAIGSNRTDPLSIAAEAGKSRIDRCEPVEVWTGECSRGRGSLRVSMADGREPSRSEGAEVVVERRPGER